MKQSEINGIKFYYRDGTSDLKTFEEVIRKDVYRKKGMTIQRGEHWIDCGGNVGAFTLLACSLGAKVTTYEPDPNNCQMIKKNLELKDFEKDDLPVPVITENEIVSGLINFQSLLIIFKEKTIK